AEQPGSSDDPDGLADHETCYYADQDGVGQHALDVIERNAHAGGEEGEDWYGDACGQGPEPMFEHLGQAGRAAFATAALVPVVQHGNSEAKKHPRDRRVNAGSMYEAPRH